MSRNIHRYTKADNKYMKDYDKNKKSPYLQYWNVNNLCGWATSQKFPINAFEWVKNISQSDESFINSYNKESDEGFFLEVDVQSSEKLHKLHNDLPFFFLKE